MAHRDGKMNWDDLHYQKMEGTYSPFVSYGQSKLANILHAVELSRRVEKDGIHVYSLHPGKHSIIDNLGIVCDKVSYHLRTFVFDNVVTLCCRCDYNRALETLRKMGSTI